jgi:hypothetical protein
MFGMGNTDDESAPTELDKKVEETLRQIAEVSAKLPEEFPKWLDDAIKKNPNVNWEGVLKKIYDEMPRVSSILGDWTSSLATYAVYRALVRQERVHQKILASNRLLARATVVLALATFGLVLVTVIRG